MNVLTEIPATLDVVRQYRRQPYTIAFVPTMGNLHAGHLSLVKAAKGRADKVIVSIFVNPAQFGPQEDYAQYPRTLTADMAMLQDLHIDLLFTPKATDLYPQGVDQHTQVKVPGLSTGLCSNTRPHFLSGVTTVVSKLFHIIQPNIAIFGEKDYQQLRCIQQMVKDLHMPIDVIGMPTQRESDGLAFSSRNQYLSSEERAKAPFLYRVLQDAIQGLRLGKNFEQVEELSRTTLNEAGFVSDYICIRTQDKLQIPSIEKELVVLAAAYLGKTRLIDNISFVLT